MSKIIFRPDTGEDIADSAETCLELNKVLGSPITLSSSGIEVTIDAHNTIKTVTDNYYFKLAEQSTPKPSPLSVSFNLLETEDNEIQAMHILNEVVEIYLDDTEQADRVSKWFSDKYEL